MPASVRPNGSRAAPLLYWRERWLMIVVFAAILFGGLLMTSRGQAADAMMLPLLGAVLAGAAADRFGLPFWHWFANRFAARNHVRLFSPIVIDGDTIHDEASGERYRFANIDAPEMEARCANERQRAELARLAVVALTKRAQAVTVRKTMRRDVYGRRVAFVFADGLDVGQALIAKGFARPWRGRRERWCGPKGGLAKIAETRAMPISCKACGAWSRF